MVIALDWLTTNVAHGGAAHTMHHIAALGLVESLLAPVADANHGLVDLVFDVSAHVHLALLLHFVASLRQMIGLLTQSIKVKKICFTFEKDLMPI